MFTRSYAFLVIESGIRRLFDNIRVSNVLTEWALSEERLKTTLVTQAIGLRNKQKVPFHDDSAIDEELLNKVRSVNGDSEMIEILMDKMPEISKAFSNIAISATPIELSFFGKPFTEPGALYRFLKSDVNETISNAEDIKVALQSFVLVLKWCAANSKPLPTASGDSDIYIKYGEQKGRIDQKAVNERVIPFLRNRASVQDFVAIAQVGKQLQSDASLSKAENVPTDLSTLLKGAVFLGKDGDTWVFKFPKGKDEQVAQALREVGDLQRPGSTAIGNCTRKTYNGRLGSDQAENYLNKTTLYSAVKRLPTGQYQQVYQCCFADAPQIKDSDGANVKLPETSFELIKNDIIQRVAQERGIDPKNLTQAVDEAIGKIKRPEEAQG